MRYGGLYVVIELAMRKLRDPGVERYKDPLLLGSLREDLWHIPLFDTLFEHWSFSHFYKPPLPGGFIPLLWPGPRMKAEKFFRRAVREHAAGRKAAGFVQLGRVAHLLTDMCCPVHVHRFTHDTDPYEWYVEGNIAKLLECDVPDVPDAERPSELIEALAAYTSRFRADAGNHHLGRVLKRAKLLRGVTSKEAAAQARELIPLAAGYTASLLRLYQRRCAEVATVAAVG
ncbi:MAG: hypothetical protein ACOY0T_15770 [Myxococcota bacterium]